jgi:hypothetical protein
MLSEDAPSYHVMQWPQITMHESCYVAGQLCAGRTAVQANPKLRASQPGWLLREAPAYLQHCSLDTRMGRA